MNQAHLNKHMPGAASTESHLPLLVGKLERVKILSNLLSDVTDKEPLQGLHYVRCKSHPSVVNQLHQSPSFGHRYETGSLPQHRDFFHLKAHIEEPLKRDC